MKLIGIILFSCLAAVIMFRYFSIWHLEDSIEKLKAKKNPRGWEEDLIEEWEEKLEKQKERIWSVVQWQ